jgi:hypothetical protein
MGGEAPRLLRLSRPGAVSAMRAISASFQVAGPSDAGLRGNSRTLHYFT